MDQAQDGQASELEELFRREAGGLAGAIRAILGPRADVQELLQEGMARAWQRRTELSAARDPKAWVFVLVMNLARDLGRKQRRRGRIDSLTQSSAMQLPTNFAGPREVAEGRETLALARKAIAGLQEEEKEVFLLRTSAELSFEAVSAALGIPVGTAKSRMRSALQSLRDRLSLGPGDENTKGGKS